MSAEIRKMSYPVNVSRELLDFDLAVKFPRKGHTVVHPITDAERADYAALKARWEAAQTEWQAVQDEAVKRGWGRELTGYEYDDAELFELEPRREFIPEETHDEWLARVEANYAHHAETGEWISAPKPTLIELITQNWMKGYK